MAIQKITYSNKSNLNTTSVSATNKVSASDLNEIKSVVNNNADLIYPVGSIYMSVNNTNPSTLFGGTWEAIEGQFLIGANSTYTAGSTGGSATHTLIANELPSFSVSATTTSQAGTQTDGFIMTGGYTSTGSTTMAHTGQSQPFSTLPPYLAVYIWKRTA